MKFRLQTKSEGRLRWVRSNFEFFLKIRSPESVQNSSHSQKQTDSSQRNVFKLRTRIPRTNCTACCGLLIQKCPEAVFLTVLAL